MGGWRYQGRGGDWGRGGGQWLGQGLELPLQHGPLPLQPLQPVLRGGGRLGGPRQPLPQLLPLQLQVPELGLRSTQVRALGLNLHGQPLPLAQQA